MARPGMLRFRPRPGLTHAVSLGNDDGLFSQSSESTQAVIAHVFSEILPYQLACGPQDIRSSIGWRVPPSRVIGQIEDGLNHAYYRYAS